MEEELLDTRLIEDNVIADQAGSSSGEDELAERRPRVLLRPQVGASWRKDPRRCYVVLGPHLQKLSAEYFPIPCLRHTQMNLYSEDE